MDRVVKKQDLELINIDNTVKCINNQKGCVVKECPGKGFGLFADRFYAKGESVTVYGGMRHKRKITGTYVVETPSGYIDASEGFKESEKGRWINDTSKNEQNVELKKLKRQLVFVAERDIAIGEEILWWYGPFYERHWLNSVSNN